jgi:predicted acetyltransferase
MTNVEIRELKGEELLEAAYQLSTYAFRATPPGPERETWKEVVRRRIHQCNYMAAVEDGRVASGAFSSPLTHNVRGKLFKAAGLWGVAALPEYRRKGYTRQAIGKLLAVNHELGRTFSCLYPFRESFYERMGYVDYPYVQIAKLSPRALTAALKIAVEGEVERLPIAESVALYRSFVEQLRDQIHGMALFDFPDTETIKQNNQFWLALARVQGKVEGLALYSLQGEEITKFNLRCTRFYYTSPGAKYLLLGWIARHVDQVDRAEIRLAPYERPNTWLPDLELRTELATWGPMGRVLAVEEIGGMEVGDGAFTLRIHDSMCPWNEGTWRFEGAGGRLSVSRAETAECELTIQGLSSLVYGINDPGDFVYRGWGSPNPGLQKTMRSLFPALTPYMHEEF